MPTKLTRRFTLLLSVDDFKALDEISKRNRRTLSGTVRHLVSEAWEKILDEERKKLDIQSDDRYVTDPIHIDAARESSS